MSNGQAPQQSLRILPRFDFRVDVAADSIVGHVRPRNEDAMLVAPELALFGIADGMGGLNAGDHASRIALARARAHIADKESARTLDEYVKTPTLERRRAVFSVLRAACASAHEGVVAEQDVRGGPMGTTLDLCLFARDKAFVAHVGDGRAFLARTHATLQLTEDHVIRAPGDSLKAGSRREPRPLSSGVGLPIPLRVDVFAVDLRKGDTIVLATDGAWDPIDDEASLAALLRGSPRAVAEQLLRHSLSRGGRDNATVVAVRVEDRLVARGEVGGHASDDLAHLKICPLFDGLPMQSLVAALAAGIEVELEPDQRLGAFEAGDLCAYVLLDGTIRTANGTLFGPPALVFAESLAGVEPRATATVVDAARAADPSRRFSGDHAARPGARSRALSQARELPRPRSDGLSAAVRSRLELSRCPRPRPRGSASRGFRPRPPRRSRGDSRRRTRRSSG
ncbi:MAG: PP2C family serine/threonine-protein phosphatase [Polyangiaceae bacterium]